MRKVLNSSEVCAVTAEGERLIRTWYSSGEMNSLYVWGKEAQEMATQTHQAFRDLEAAMRWVIVDRKSHTIYSHLYPYS